MPGLWQIRLYSRRHSEGGADVPGQKKGRCLARWAVRSRRLTVTPAYKDIIFRQDEKTSSEHLILLGDVLRGAFRFFAYSQTGGREYTIYVYSRACLENKSCTNRRDYIN